MNGNTYVDEWTTNNGNRTGGPNVIFFELNWRKRIERTNDCNAGNQTPQKGLDQPCSTNGQCAGANHNDFGM